MKQIWNIPGYPVCYAAKDAAEHEAAHQRVKHIISYSLRGVGKRVPSADLYTTAATKRGYIIDLFLGGLPFVYADDNTLTGDVYLLNASVADITPTYQTNPKRRRNPVSGEWWIQDGSAQFADGDVGDMNHEAYVIDHLAGLLLGHIDIETNEERVGPMSEYEDQIVQWLIDEGGVDKEAAEDDPADELYNILVKQLMPKQFKTEDQFRQAFFIAWGSKGTVRAADYAIQYDGWKRVQNNWVETWTFTKEDIKSIVDGLSDANGDLEDDDLFNIEVRATKTEYNDVPLAVLEKANYSELSEYATKHRTNPKRRKTR